MHRISTFFLLFALCWICTGCQTNTTIANNIPDRDANEIVVLLHSRGIQAEKHPAPVSAVGGGGTAELYWDIAVPSQQITEALSILNQMGLPRVKGTSLLDLFGSQGLVPSDLQDRIRYQEGLSSQLASTIRKMDGIIDANVQITFPRDEETTKTLTASVYLKHRGILDNPNSLTITKVKRLVASAVPGLTPENVSVVSDRAPYSDIAFEPLQQHMKEGEYLSVWGIAVAKESLSRFRLVFYAFILILFILASALAWLIWKLFPIIQMKGGPGSLLQPEQYEPHLRPKEEIKKEIDEE